MKIRFKLGILACFFSLFLISLAPAELYAFFEYGQLIQVVYKQDDNEIGVDLISIDDLDQENVQIAPPGTVNLSGASQMPSTDSWADVRAGIFAYYTDEVNFYEFYIATANPLAPDNIRENKYVGLYSPMGAVYQDYLLYASNSRTAILSATGLDGYNRRLNLKGQSVGTYNNFLVGDNADDAAPYLAPLDSADGYLDMYLYKYRVDETTGGVIKLFKGSGKDYVAVIRILADGSTVLNPTVSDSDGDNVEDSKDKCPNTPAGASVNADGCPDSDGDGVYDDVDMCDDTPLGATVNANGCPDTDGDGVFFDVDQCPNTPAGTPVDETGCPLPDADGDGVADADDHCPDTPAGADVNDHGCPDLDGDNVWDDVDKCLNTEAGVPVDETGCALPDADGDGVADRDDQCPDTPAGVTVNSEGCADSDGDGVADGDDLCGDTPAGTIVDENGCPDDTKNDDDGDGVPNSSDTCPDTPSGTTVDAVGCPVTTGTDGTAPSLLAPEDSSEVATRRPVLSVNNVTGIEGDNVTYTFEVYKDEALNLLLVSGSVHEGNGTTEWQGWDDGFELPRENRYYYWRVRAGSGTKVSAWMPTASFYVNAVNNRPDAPEIATPVDGASLDTVSPVLTVVNAGDEATDTRTYRFEIYEDEALDSLVSSTENVAEGSDNNSTSWHVDLVLRNGAWYWWRARATDTDGEESDWSKVAHFQIDVDNDAPTIPLPSHPVSGEVLRPVDGIALTVENADDPEGESLTYFFELDTDAAFSGEGKKVSEALPEGADGMTSWQPSGIVDNTEYFWRAIAFDGQVYSENWTTTMTFTTSSNIFQPGIPLLNSPVSGVSLNSEMPTLSVINTTDADDDVLTYEFEVFESGSDEPVFSATGVVPGTEYTSVVAQTGLKDGHAYAWRARADDGAKVGEWMPAADFSIDLGLKDEDVIDSQTILSKRVDNNGDDETVLRIGLDAAQKHGAISLYGVEVVIPAGAVTEDTNFTIGVAKNVPALPNNYALVNDVLVLGPAGVTFNKAITIRVPLNSIDSKSLAVFTKDHNGGAWAKLSVKEITDTDVVFETDHFSLFAITEVSNGGGNTNDGGSSGGGGGGGCFIGAVVE